MTKKQTLYWIYALSALFIAGNAYLYLVKDMWLGLMAPAALAVALLGLFRLDLLIWGIVLITPLSVSLEDGKFGLGVSLPSEPLMFGAMILFLINHWYKSSYDLRVLRHPISIAIIASIIWMIITSLASTHIDVSMKYTLARIWFVTIFYFAMVDLFRRNLVNMRWFVWLYSIPFAFVIVYFVVRLGSLGFEKQVAHWAMEPFYKDHGIFAACLTMFIPLLAGFSFLKKYPQGLRMTAGILLFIFMAGLIFSYTRAAWVSLVGALAVYVAMRLRISFKYIALLVAAGVIIFFSVFDQVMMEMERNKTDSSGNITEHVESISNISTDASNLERINRWNSAIEMWKEKPVFGWGPGTYSFEYAPFQHSEDLTIISTNFGDMGNAHSEYLGPLSEQGVLGIVLMILIVGLFSWRAIVVWEKHHDKELRMLVMGAFLGLVTYFVHGVLNNYLDTDEASVPVWGMMAMITAIDLYYPPKELDQ